MAFSTACEKFVLQSLDALAAGDMDQAGLKDQVFTSASDKKVLNGLANVRNLLRIVIEQSNNLADGVVTVLPEIGSENSVLTVLNSVAGSLANIAGQADQIAKGDYSAEISPRSDKDVLGIAMADMTKTLREAATVCQAVAIGDFSKNVELKGDKDLLGNAVNDMVVNFRDIADQADQISKGDYSAEISPRSDKDTLGIAMANMTKTLREAATVCQAVAIGDFTKNIELKGDKDLLGNAINEMVTNFKDIADQADQISKGDYSAEISPRSDKDTLGIAMANMTKTLREAATVCQAVAIGDFTKNIELKGDKDLLGNAIADMTLALKTAETDTRKEQWIKSGQTELFNEIRGEQDIIALSRRVIGYLTKYIGGQVGVIYTANENDELVLTGSYAHSKRKKMLNILEVGEGLAGQAVLEKETMVVSDIPADYIDINSTLGDSRPRNLLISPVVADNRVRGVIEIGSYKPINDEQIELFKNVTESVAIAINSALDRGKMQDLLEESQRQGEELQAQQEELQTSNEEMEQQTKALVASEASLKEQSEELQSANEELEEQTQALRVSEEELKQQSQELQASNEELEENSKNLELQKQAIEGQKSNLEEVRQDLEVQTKELRQSNKYKSEFLSNMSHELRTPLNSMLILSKSLADNKDGSLTDSQSEAAHVINSSGNDLLRLINDILDLSKVEAGKMELNLEEVMIEEQITTLSKQFKPLAEEKGLKLKTKIGSNIEESLITDSQRLQQILKNLMSNAIKFTAEGSITLQVEHPEHTRLRHLKLSSEKILAISVIDTGIGVPQEKRFDIFEAFQQADGSTSRHYGGTGLGLTISRELAILLGGELHLAESSNSGSRFTLYLPLEKPVLEEDDDEDQHRDEVTPIKNQPFQNEAFVKRQVKSDASEPENKKPVTHEYISDDRKSITLDDRSILIIEDDRNFAKILQDVAREWNFQTIVTDLGVEGLTLAEELKPSSILLDLGLPDMDGERVLKHLKDNLVTRHIPVHIISAEDSNNSILKMGAIGFLSKPVSSEDLETVFSRFEDTLQNRIKNILVVEDDKGSQAAIKKLVGSNDVKIKMVDTGKKALAALQKNHFDCIILDLKLPDMSGFDILDNISKSENGPTPPVIVYTGAELSKSERSKLEKRANSVVIKGSESPARLIDDVTLFLHSIEENLPSSQREVIKNLHDRNRIFKDRKILLVDDDMRNIFALSRLLSEAGLNVQAADNGKLALETLAKTPDFDLVLMDIMMPVMDGLEAIRKIRAQSLYADLPIIAVTAKAMQQDRQDCLDAGANDYVTKPVDIEKLLALLRMWLFKEAAE